MQNLKALKCLFDQLHCKLSGYRNPVGLIEAEIWDFQVAHPGYLPLGVDRPVLKQVASGDRAIGVYNTTMCRLAGSACIPPGC